MKTRPMSPWHVEAKETKVDKSVDEPAPAPGYKILLNYWTRPLSPSLKSSSELQLSVSTVAVTSVNQKMPTRTRLKTRRKKGIQIKW